jgi:hypothetical protein
MVGVSNRIMHIVGKMPRPADPLIEYQVLDPMHEPDLNGELAGGKVYKRSGKEFVKLTAEQARFYLDSGSIAPVEQAGAQAQATEAPKK